MIDVADICDSVVDAHQRLELCEHSACPGCHYVMGAAVLAGLMGMAFAIQESRPVKASIWCNCGDWDEDRPETYLCPIHNPTHESTCPMGTGGTFCSCSGNDIVTADDRGEAGK